MVYTMDLRRTLNPMLSYQAHICSLRMMQNYGSIKTWFDVGIFQFDGKAATYIYTLLYFVWHRCIQSHVKQEILWGNILYFISTKVANDQLMTVKEAIKCLISFGNHTFEIITYLLSFSISLDHLRIETMPEIERNSKYSKLELRFTQMTVIYQYVKQKLLSSW